MIHKWHLVSRKIILKHPRAIFAEDIVQLPNGKQIPYFREMPIKNHSVAVIAINNKDEILLQKEYSYPPNKVMYQLPGGTIEDNEDIIQAANRELSEESGYIGGVCTIIGSFYVNNRRSDKKQHVVICKDLTPQKRPEDPEEFIENEWIATAKINQLVQDGAVDNINLLAALHLFAIKYPNYTA